MARPPASSTSKGQLGTRRINTIKSHSGPINALTFSSPPSQTYLLTGSSDRQIHLHRVTPQSSTQQANHHTPSPISTPPIQSYSAHGYPILSLSCSLTNTTFASSGGDRTSPFLWDVTSGSTIRRFGSNSSHGHSSRVPCVTFAGQTDSLLVSGSDDRSVRIWDVLSRDTRPIMTWEDARDGITCIIPSYQRQGTPSISGVSEHEILTGSVDSRLRTYDIRMGKLTTDVLPAPIVSLDITRDSSAVLIGCMDSRLRLLDRREGTLLQSFGGGDSDTSSSSSISPSFQNTSLRLQSIFSPPTESHVLVGSEKDGLVRAYDVVSGDLVEVIDTSRESISDREKERRGSAGERGGDRDTDKPISTLAARKGVRSGEGAGIWASGGLDGIVRVYGP